MKIDSKEEPNFRNVDFGEVLDFISRDDFVSLEKAMNHRIDVMMEEVFPHNSVEEKIISVTYLLLNYHDKELISYLSKLKNEQDSNYFDIKNGRICNIPLIEFSKLGNCIFSEELRSLRFEEEPEPCPRNKEVLLEVTKLLKIKPIKLSSISKGKRK